MGVSGDRQRDRNGIFYDILTIANGGSKKTKIMFGANLTHEQVGIYLDKLGKSKLLETYESDEGIFYKTTSNGMKFIAEIENLKKLFDPAYVDWLFPRNATISRESVETYVKTF
jgi:predicted transcriptional regulator